jgi:hypothetical protein
MISKFTRNLFRAALFFLSFLFGSFSNAQTFVSGIITSDTTFTIAGSPYLVTANLIINNGFTLTIEPGVTVKFNQNTSLLILGKLLVNGSTSGVTFTANTNSPTPGYWGGISFGAIASPAIYDINNNYLSGSVINNAMIDYAGSTVSNVFGSIAMTGSGVPHIRNVKISNCAYPGIYAKSINSKLVVKQTQVQNCHANSSSANYSNIAAGINIRLANADVILDSNIIENNTGAGVAVMNQVSSSITISNNRIYKNNNFLTGNGGGLCIDSKAQTFQNLVYLNNAVRGGAIYSDTAGATGGKLYFNIFYANNATDGAAFWGKNDTITNNVFAYNIGTNEIVKAYGSQHHQFNQYTANSSIVVFKYFGPYFSASVNKNSFSNNKAGAIGSSLIKFDGATPINAIENNLLSNIGYTYFMQLLNNNNTSVVPAQNCFWRTTGTPTISSISALIFDVNDDVSQGQLTFLPFQTSPRTDCPISGVTSPVKIIIGDSLLVYWNRKSGENVAGYKVHYGGSDGLDFSKFINTNNDTFVKISVLENIDSVGVSSYSTLATQTYSDYITGAQSWYTFADWVNTPVATITSFTPTSGTFGDSILITGTNLTAASVVKFGGTAASSFSVISPTSIKAFLAKGSSGNVFVTTPISSNTLSGFRYLAIPNIFSFTPAIASIGNVVTIKGFHFTGTSTVSFGGTNAASFTISGDTMISAVLANGASGNIVVINSFGSDTIAGFNFCAAYSLNLIDTTRICGDSVLLTVTPGFSSYLWNTGATTSSIYAKLNINYSVQVVNALGCIGRDTTRVIINTLPAPIISGKQPVCVGSIENYKTPKNIGRTYAWAITGGTINSGQTSDSLMVTWGAAGLGTLTVKDSVNATGCNATTSVYNVTINPNPTPSIIGEDTVCANSAQIYKTAKNTGRSYLWTIAGGTILFGQGTDSIRVVWGTASTRLLSVQDSINATGCKTTTNLNVLILANPTPVISGNNIVCGGINQTYTTPANAGRSYIWTITNGTIISGQNTASVIVNWSNAFSTGTLRVKDSINVQGCNATSSLFNVTINVSPSPVISGQNIVCNNIAAVYVTPRNLGRTYLWTINGGVITSGQNTDTLRVTWGAAGTGSLTVSDSVNTTGCKTTTSVYSVLIQATPTPVISGVSTACSGTTLVYTTPSNIGRSYFWTITGGVIAIGQGTANATVTWGPAGPGTLTVKDSIIGSDCKATSSIFNVTINAIPTPIITGSTNVCQGSASSYATTSNTGRTYVWTITGGTIVSGDGTPNISVNWGAAGSGSLVVSDSVNATGCKGLSSSYGITINANPTPVISGSKDVCAGTSKIYTTPSLVGHTYRWTVVGGSIVSGQGTATLTVAWPTIGAGSITVMDSINAAGCKTTTGAYSININANPTPIVSGASVVCALSTSAYSTPFNGSRVYVWSVTGGIIAAGQGSPNVLVTWGSSGTGTLVVSDSATIGGCKTISSALNVTINANPTPTISGSNVVCSGSSATYATPAFTGHAYYWVITGGVITSGQGSASINVIWAGSGLGTLAVTDTLISGNCFATTPNYLVNKISGSNPIITGSKSVCTNSNNSYSTPFNTGRSYFWNVVGGTVTSGQGTAVVDVLWGLVGSGSLTVTDSIDGLGCKSTTAPYNVAIIAKPSGIVSGSNELCANSNAMYGTVNNTNLTFAWTVTGGTITSGQGTSNIMVTWGSGPSGLVSLTGSLVGSSCTFEASRVVKINLIPSADFTVIQSAGKLTLVPKQAGLSCKWLFGDGDSSNSNFPTHTYAVNGFYTIKLKAMSPQGCLNESTQTVNVTSVGMQELFASMYQMKAYPNPFQGKTTISFNLFEPSDVEMEVFDLTGRLVQTMLPLQELKQGKFEFEFNSEVTPSASSVYLVKVKIANQTQYLRIVHAN